MDEANKIVHSVLDHAEKNIKSGMTTRELNSLLEQKLSEFPEAKSAFKGYKGYPDVSCISVNEQVVHGIPGDRIILDGDIVSVDFGVYYKGMAGDAARTFIVGSVSEEIRKLVADTRLGLFEGIDKMRVGNTLHDVSRAIDAVAKANGYGNVKGFCGHGIGERMHEAPNVFNYVEPWQDDVRLRTGMVFALEPMFNLGTSDTIILEDNWTVITKDGRPSCHWELSVAITDDGPKILGAER